jgi:lactoylglutathione lyase
MRTGGKMDLGIFSVSLTVKDIAASRAFYEKLGFEVIDGNQEQLWLILRNGKINIGLFQGMFDRNMLTFNPVDVRAIQKHLKAQGVKLDVEADENTTGPAHATLQDPDGNPILFDQHEEEFMKKYR